MNIKKTTLGLGSLTSIVAPVITAVACGTEETRLVNYKIPKVSTSTIEGYADVAIPSDYKVIWLSGGPETTGEKSIPTLLSGIPGGVLKLDYKVVQEAQWVSTPEATNIAGIITYPDMKAKLISLAGTTTLKEAVDKFVATTVKNAMIEIDAAITQHKKVILAGGSYGSWLVKEVLIAHPEVLNKVEYVYDIVGTFKFNKVQRDAVQNGQAFRYSQTDEAFKPGLEDNASPSPDVVNDQFFKSAMITEIVKKDYTQLLNPLVNPILTSKYRVVVADQDDSVGDMQQSAINWAMTNHINIRSVSGNHEESMVKKDLSLGPALLLLDKLK